MQLQAIYFARQAWKTLSGLKKPPRLAYQLRKYEEQILRELTVIEKERAERIAHYGTIEPGSEDYHKFQAEMNEFLLNEIDLKPFEMTMAEMIDHLSGDSDNAISEQELEQLEPFFK